MDGGCQVQWLKKSLFIKKAFLSLDLMCTHEAMKGEGDSHLYTWSASQINFGNQWSVSHIALSPALRRCCRNAVFWSGSILFSMGDQMSWVWKVRIQLPSGPFLAGRGTIYRRVLYTRRNWESRQCDKATWSREVFLVICLVGILVTKKEKLIFRYWKIQKCAMLFLVELNAKN